MNIVLSFIFVLLASSSFIYAQNNDLAKTKAVEILAKAKKAVSSKIDVSNLKSLSASSEGTNNGGVEFSEKYEYNIAFSTKINRKWTLESKNSKATILETLNDNQATVKEDSVWASGSKSRSDFRKITGLTDGRVKSLMLQTSEFLLPYVLDFLFIKTNGFIFVGVAESETGKADVLQTVTENKETYQLLFDQKTRRLLMMAKKFTDDGKELEQNFYFTEYKENQGLIIPHKIIVKGKTNYGDLYIESNLKNFKVNPVFDEKTFEIKEK